MLLLIDNYDSFTWNLVQRFGEIAPDLPVEVHRNDAITGAEIADKAPSHLVISPGPCTPDQAGISCDVIRRFAGRMPILGVCLGHQSIGQAFGGVVTGAREIRHGKLSRITHEGGILFEGLPKSFSVVRYHSLAVERATLPAELVADACTEDGEIMALHHVSRPVFGVQFHPESILTEHGHALLKNFLRQIPQ